MVIAHKFAWGHIEKTGGDVTLTYFLALKHHLRFFYDGFGGGEKHKSFAYRQISNFGRTLALNIRRLPSWILAYFYHFHIHFGEKMIDFRRDVLEKTRPEYSMDYSTRADFMLNNMLRGKLKISRWFRCENILDDFSDFIVDYVPLNKEEIRAKLTPIYVKPFNNYDHDLSKYWTLDDMRIIYNNNPVWTAAERQAYGNLLVD
jgi:hypothetical protein